jgi:cytoskeletal protein RodZ
MAQFYKELRELRLSKEITLEELENRTKINAKYLEAIEEGNFDILPIPYLRLFLRAYAIEIGGNSERALEQLDSFIGNTKPKIIPSQQNENTMEDNSNSEKISLRILFSNSNLKLRKDIIKVGVLSVFFIFSIFIIKKIFSNEIDYSNNSSEKKVIRKMELITEEKLITNYTEDKFIEESLSIEPPFFLTLLSGSDIGITIEQDTLKPYIKYLNPGTELNLEGFISKAELMFTNTKKLRVRLNGIELNPIKNYSHPLRLLIKSSPPSFTARLYKPIY